MARRAGAAVAAGGARRGVEFGTALSSFEQSECAVAATVARAGEVATVRASWLVGCDGRHSRVRKDAGVAFEGETREEAHGAAGHLGPEFFSMKGT